MIAKGNVWKFGDNVDTDSIIAGKYLALDYAEMGKHCFENVDPEFARKVTPGDVIVAGSNFGCGSSREGAAAAVKGAAIGCVIARSFARIFYRNAFNQGLPIVECDEAVEGIAAGDVVEIDQVSGLICNLTTGRRYQAKPFPDFILELIKAGGMVEYVRQQLAQTERKD